MSHNVLAFKFQDVRIIVPCNVLDRQEKEMLLLDKISARKKLMIALRKTFIAVYTIVEDLIFSLIGLVACICL